MRARAITACAGQLPPYAALGVFERGGFSSKWVSVIELPACLNAHTHTHTPPSPPPSIKYASLLNHFHRGQMSRMLVTTCWAVKDLSGLGGFAGRGGCQPVACPITNTTPLHFPLWDRSTKKTEGRRQLERSILRKQKPNEEANALVCTEFTGHCCFFLILHLCVSDQKRNLKKKKERGIG